MPRKGLEPPRCYSLVPETSASTNSATWAFRKAEDHIKKNNSTQAGLLEEFKGVVEGHRDGHGFVMRDDGQTNVYLPPNEMRAVLHKDIVIARVTRLDKKGRPEGRILEITQRPAHPIIGRLLHESGVWLVAPEDRRYGQDILIPKTATGKALPGQVVVVELTEPPSLYGQPVGRVQEVLGEMDDPGMEIEIAVRKYSVPHVFSPACLKQAESLPDLVSAKDFPHRVDLTDIPLVTIDGEDAKDFDDAVYCEPLKIDGEDGWRLLVAIADVSHYVETESPIDIDAYDRATSVYFPRRVIPMLPEKLSNGLCSLKPDVDRGRELRHAIALLPVGLQVGRQEGEESARSHVHVAPVTLKVLDDAHRDRRVCRSYVRDQRVLGFDRASLEHLMMKAIRHAQTLHS